MQSPLKRALTSHLQTLYHDFMCLDLSIVDTNEIQARRLASLNLSIDCLRFTVEGFTFSQESPASIIHEELCGHIMTIADIAQFLLSQGTSDWPSEAISYLEAFILTLKQIYDDVEVYKASMGRSA